MYEKVEILKLHICNGLAGVVESIIDRSVFEKLIGEKVSENAWFSRELLQELIDSIELTRMKNTEEFLCELLIAQEDFLGKKQFIFDMNSEDLLYKEIAIIVVEERD